MAEIEEYFPRGGKKPTSKTFKQSGNFLGVPEKAEKKKKKPKKKSEGDDGYLSDENENEHFKTKNNFIVGLSYKTIKEGVLVLARVRNVQETKLLVMMPGRMMGSVMACHISEPYNKVLEAYVNDQVDKVKELPQMFKPGQYIAVKVLDVEGEKVMLSAMPQHVNGGKKFADLHKSTVLQAAVSSIEDHGYVMDIGMPNTRAFLPKNEVNPELDLDVGMLAWCAIKSVSQTSESSIVTLSTTLAALQYGVIRHKPDTPLLPGTALQFTVETPLDNGIQGQVFEDTAAFILRQHADKVKGKKPNLGQKITARVLYVIPTRKAPFLTMKNIFETTYPDLSAEQKFKDGDIVEEAQVLSVSGRGVLFKLGQGCTGSMSVKRIQIDEELTDQEVIAKSYPIGSTHKVRIICYNLCDYIYSVSDQVEVLNQKYFSLDQLKVGEIVNATVKNIAEAHVVLNLGRFTGMVPHAHITEAGIIRDIKKGTSKLAKHKYKVGQEVRARVLTVDPIRRALFLTMKPSLLSPDIEVLSSVEQAEVGKAYTGIIKYIKDYIIVSFFDNVCAYVPKHYVTKDPVENLMEAFHVGQIVNCTILTVDKESKKLFGSLTTTPFWPAKKREKGEKRKKNAQDTVVPKKKSKLSDEDSDALTDEETQTETPVENTEKKNKKAKGKKKQEVTETVSESTEKSKKSKKQTKADAEVSTKDEKKKDKKAKTQIETEEIKPKRKREDTEISTSSDPIDTDFAEEDQTEEILDSKKESKKQKVENQKAKDTQVTKDEPKSKKKKKKAKEEITQAAESIDIKDLETHETQDEPKSKKAKKKQKKAEEEKNNTENIAPEGLKPALEIPCTKDFWSAKLENLTKDAPEDDSSSSDDETTKDQKKKRKKLSVKEKLEKARAEEERVRDMERRAIESESQPRSSDQFERALLANPNCSQLWIAYMAFHLQATEIEKARAVAKKALNTISFREEDEKLNVWLALINLENRFGAKESQQKTLEEALQMNDTYKVHSKLLDIYVETSKHQELSSLVDLMLKKYRRQPENYVQCGHACFNLGLVDKARQVMQKAISVLQAKEHVPVLVQFALLEGKHGALERSEALFEHVLTVYPERVDVCSAYIDMLVKRSDLERVREVLDRMTSQKLPARKMKVLFKKWLDVEESIGDPQKMEEIQRRAKEYVQKSIS